MKRLLLTIRADAFDDVLDTLLPMIPQGVHRSAGAAGTLRARHLRPDAAASRSSTQQLGDALVAAAEDEAPDDAVERRLLYLEQTPVAGRLVVRPSNGKRVEEGMLDVIVDSPDGSFGSGNHPTTVMCLEILLEMEPGGGFADLGCGSGVLAITAALLGYTPVLAIDHEVSGVEATLRNATANDVTVEAHKADLLAIPPRPCRRWPPTSRRACTSTSPPTCRATSST